ncbi:MAG: thioesterase [Flavobacterium sp.]|uniref:thioesterase II family protein n=1 Tax=Flavobacterium sp. TaxID=239 RepID=UPI001B0AF2D2|nr:thioesterase domain-containing protein [Flavobacterium sp.]MBO9586223.1 thioesterase [Flavobacterium sp.]
MKKIQLFLIPFAGGNCYSFNFLMPYLKDFDVVTLELPGRGKRIKESLLTEFDQAAEDIFQQIIARQTASFYIIYGHSLGTGIGLRVANMLQKINRAPAYLVFTGNPGPGIKENRKLYLYEKFEFMDEIKKLGGLPDELRSNLEFMDFIEPVFRADFELAERNKLVNERAVNVPIYSVMGDLEKTSVDIANWKRFTNASFHSEILTGDHFFIYNHPERIANILQQCVENTRELEYKT